MKTPLIIDRPDLQSPGQRAASAVMTALFWLLWVMLWLPLLTLGAWVFFGNRFHLHMVVFDGYQGFASLLGTYAMVILLMGGGLVAWAKYNHLRFRGMDRRKATPAPTPAALARHFGHDAAQLAQWRDARVLMVHHDALGTITAAQMVGPGAMQTQPVRLPRMPAEAEAA